MISKGNRIGKENRRMRRSRRPYSRKGQVFEICNSNIRNSSWNRSVCDNKIKNNDNPPADPRQINRQQQGFQCGHIPMSVVGSQIPPRRPNIFRHPSLADDGLMYFIGAAMDHIKVRDIVVEKEDIKEKGEDDF
ncbi:hypothetical protein M422DRAFT_39880 [Sphaerobolus stellatus SS14]|uniref:Uncharacterized protein n=1 Tax=Sphaerobolus stellatus (strain SS14) TaxID=990650 RepID=A0A0C9TM78_SPHS4|nr:hypothetical protein M422DRAFT_39880 [Sphaerobolus stellatus SS14]